MDRMILTHDHGYLNDRRFPPNRNPGVIILPKEHPDSEDFLVALDAALVTIGVDRDFWRGTKTVVSSGGLEITIKGVDASGARTRRRFRFAKGDDVFVWEPGR